MFAQYTHGGIDSFSREVVYLTCHSNNRAETALTEFRAAVDNFGPPSRVRTDQGVENVEIARLLTHPERGEGRGSHTLERVYTIKESKDCGGMCIMHVHLSTMLCSGSWKTMEFLMWKTRLNQFFVS